MAKALRTAPAAIRSARRKRAGSPPPRGLWHKPALLNLVADLLILAAVAALTWALVVWLLSRPLLPIREIVVHSPLVEVTAEQLEYAARTAVKGNFFTVDLGAVKNDFEKLPWVRKADVRRRWPDALVLSLEEHQAVAYWTVSDQGDSRLVNRHGEVFVAASNAAMPHFDGSQGSAAGLLKHYEAFSRLLQPFDAELQELALSPRAAWQLKLDSGLLILLGRDQERAPLFERLQRFIAVWPRVREEVDFDIKVADLRYPSGFALTPADGTVLLPAKSQSSSRGKQQ